MRLHIVSDVHGRAEDLAAAGAGARALICLGDLLLYLDYADHSSGILADLFGAEAAGRIIALRGERRFDEARAFSAQLWSTVPGSREETIEEAVRRQYARTFAAFPTPTYLTYGNVDLPALWPDYLRPGLTVLDGAAVDIDGLRLGFVGGGLRTPMRTPYEVDDEVYAAKVRAVGAVDVLCTHIPPQVPDLLYDVKSHRYERGSVAVLEAIQDMQPRYALFGHVHQPYAAEVRIGRTRCINVGHFRARRTPYVLEL